MYIFFPFSSLATTQMSIYLKFKVHLLIIARGIVILIGHNRLYMSFHFICTQESHYST